jgi:hypothetical protein
MFRYECTTIFRENEDCAFSWYNEQNTSISICITPLIIYPSMTNHHIIPYFILEFQYGRFQKGFPTKIVYASLLSPP